MKFFKRKTEKEKLEIKYNQLLKESHLLSTIDRTKSDAKKAEAEEVWKKIESI